MKLVLMIWMVMKVVGFEMVSEDNDPDFAMFYEQDREKEKNKGKEQQQLQEVQYVKSISKAGKMELEQQKMKKDSYLVGKPVYFESGMTFDDNPTIYGDPTSNTIDDVDVPMNDNTLEKHNLWTSNNQQKNSVDNPIDYGQVYKDVYYKDKEGDFVNLDKFRQYNTIIEQNVGVSTVNRNKYQENKKDPLMEGVQNPIRQQLVEKISQRQFQLNAKAKDDKQVLMDRLGQTLENDLDAVLS